MSDFKFGNYIYELRKQSGYGQKEVAAFAESVIKRFLNGKPVKPSRRLNSSENLLKYMECLLKYS